MVVVGIARGGKFGGASLVAEYMWRDMHDLRSVQVVMDPDSELSEGGKVSRQERMSVSLGRSRR